MLFGSLFTGIGGLDLGLERAGMRCAWQVEQDDYCQQVLARHWPGVSRYGDVQDCGAHNLAPVDLICGGFPCQPVSAAGARAGMADDRWLWPEFARVVRELQPRWVVAENVPGLLSANAGRAMGEVLGVLAASGYDCIWDIFPAGGPGGVGAPHRRERVFVVAHAVSIGSEERHPERGEQTPEGKTDYAMPRGAPLADADSFRCINSLERHYSVQQSRSNYQQAEKFTRGDHWPAEPDVGRVAHGVPRRMDRLRTLGNAVVPQVAEGVGRMIMEASD